MALIKKPPEQIDEACDRHLAEAAVWIACLHADDCDDRDRKAFMTWLNECDAHRRAFTRVSEAWEIAGGLSIDLDTAAAGALPSLPGPEARCCEDDTTRT
jgi:transmembrane sensor